jgi:hypothetical protein
MIYPWLLPLLVLATGIVVNYYFNLYILTLAAILILIISAGLNGFFRYIVLNLEVFFTGFFMLYLQVLVFLLLGQFLWLSFMYFQNFYI